MKKMTSIPLLLLSSVLLLAGCGGTTEGQGGENGNGNGNGGGNISVSLVTSSAVLPSNAATSDAGVTLTAIITNSANNLVEGQSVNFAADSGAIQLTQPNSDMAGTATAILTTNGNPATRVINVTASAGGSSDTSQIQVTGTQLSLNGPQALAQNATGTYTVSLTDAAGDGISGQPVMVNSANGNTLSMSNPPTDSGGQAQFQVTGNVNGPDTLTASALGLSAQTTVVVGGDDFQFTAPGDNTQIPLNTPTDVTLTWLNNGAPVSGETINFSTTRGTLNPSTVTTDSSGQATVSVQANNAGPAKLSATEDGGLTATRSFQFIATQPASISVQSNPASVGPTGQSTVTATVRDGNNNLVTGANVTFNLTDTSGGMLSDASVVTDTRGTATTTYTAGNISAATPARITASVGAFQDTAMVTIGGQALRIVLGTGNEITEPDLTTYQQPYTAIVTDAAGNPVPDADFRLSILAVSYQKGSKVLTDVDGDGTADQYVPVYNVATGTPQTDGFGCLNEDLNANGILDADEDVNGNGTLEPGNVATVPSANNIELDENARALFNITYPQNFSQWVRVRLRAVASVQGTESIEDAVFTLPVLADDVTDPDVSPPGATSPFGTGASCSDPD